MNELVDLIADSHQRWLPQVVTAVLGTVDPISVAKAITTAVAVAMDTPVVAARFYEPGVGIVVGLELGDGREVVGKVHGAPFVNSERLAAVARIQADLVGLGVPAPAPLTGPLALGDGWLMIEEFRGGGTADGYEPAVRRGIATALHELVEAARPHAGDELVGRWLGAPVVDGLWPLPHDLRFDLSGTTDGAEWIDQVARAARSTLTSADLPDVVAHLDWRVQNLAFDGDRVTAIYDWDSIRLAPEAVLVGNASVVHPVDWRLDKPDPLPTLGQLDGFVQDYEAVRGEPFDHDERQVLTAAQRWVAAYGARCQHSDDVLGLFPHVDHSRGWPRLLRDLLGRSVGR